MASHGLYLWLLINLGYHHSFYPRVSKRSIHSSGDCASRESQDLNSFLWVMKRSPPVYFFGTIHVPYTKVWDYVPANSKQAFYETDNIYFELDLTDSVTLTTLAQCQVLPNGLILREVIPRTLYKRIRRHLSYVRKMMSEWVTMDQIMFMGLTPIQLYKKLTRDWYKKRPIWIMLLLNSLTEYDTKNRGSPVLDMFLIREAVSKNKKTGSIETVQEQCKPLNALNNSQVILALSQTLVLHEKIRSGEAKLAYSTRELIHHYNCGNLTEVLFAQDMSHLVKLANLSSTLELEQTQKIDKYLRKELIYERNKRMAKRVAHLIHQEPKKSFFFAFGAGHFLGKDSIIDILKKQGHNISHVQPDASLPRYGKKRMQKNNRKEKNRCKRKRRQRWRRGSKGQKQRRRKSSKKCFKHVSYSRASTTSKTTMKISRTTLGSFEISRPSSSSHNYGFQLWWVTFLVFFSRINILG